MSNVVEDCLDRLAKAAAGIRGAQEDMLEAQHEIFLAIQQFQYQRSRLYALQQQHWVNLTILMDITPHVMAGFVRSESEESEVKEIDRLHELFARSFWDSMYGEGNNDEAGNAESHAFESDAPGSGIGLQSAPGFPTSAAVPKPMSAPAAVAPKAGNYDPRPPNRSRSRSRRRTVASNASRPSRNTPPMPAPDSRSGTPGPYSG